MPMHSLEGHCCASSNPHLQSLVDGGKQHDEAEKEGCYDLKGKAHIQTKTAFASNVVPIIIPTCRMFTASSRKIQCVLTGSNLEDGVPKLPTAYHKTRMCCASRILAGDQVVCKP